jgi:S1-C subfamily serine protease
LRQGAPARLDGGRGGDVHHRSNSLGSGFIIDASGIVVTNNHVIGDANDIQVILAAAVEEFLEQVLERRALRQLRQGAPARLDGGRGRTPSAPASSSTPRASW